MAFDVDQAEADVAAELEEKEWTACHPVFNGPDTDLAVNCYLLLRKQGFGGIFDFWISIFDLGGTVWRVGLVGRVRRRNMWSRWLAKPATGDVVRDSWSVSVSAAAALWRDKWLRRDTFVIREARPAFAQKLRRGKRRRSQGLFMPVAAVGGLRNRCCFHCFLKVFVYIPAITV
jgi:hypothetical protein